MRTSREGASKGTPASKHALIEDGSDMLLGLVLETLDEAKAMDVMSIDLADGQPRLALIDQRIEEIERNRLDGHGPLPLDQTD